jgi:hypothetical protein
MKNLAVVLGVLAIAWMIINAVALHLPHLWKTATVVSTGPTVERLERLSHLATMRVLVADVLTGEGDGFRGSWLIKGDGLLGVNLSRATIVEKDERSRHAVVRLPQPEVLQSRVDHGKTRTWEVKKTGWIPWGGNQDQLRDQVMQQAQELVAHVAASEENIRQAKAAAENVIRAFYEEVGWKVDAIWESDTSGRP